MYIYNGTNCIDIITTTRAKCFSVWFGWVWFYGLSTIVDYLMPNSAYTSSFSWSCRIN